MANERSDGPVTIFGPDFPFAFDDWLNAPGRPGLDPGRTARRGSGRHRRRHLRAGRRLRADEARGQAGGLRGVADGRAAAVTAVRGGRRRGRRTGRHALPGFVDDLLPLRGQAGIADPAVPQPADRGGRQHGRRPGGRHLLRQRPGRPSPAVPRGRGRVGAGPGGGALHRDPERDPDPRRGDAEGAVERPRAALGRPHVLRLRGHLPGVLEALVPASRGVRAGRVWYRRLGLGLPELHAGDLPGGDDQLRLRPAPGRRRGGAGPARDLALPRAGLRPLAGRHLAGRAALGRAPARRRADRPRRRRPARGHRRLGRHPPLRRGPGDLPELAAHHADRVRGKPVLAEAVDGPGPDPVHAVLQDLRDGRPAVLDGQGPAYRPRRDEHDADRPADARHLPVRQRRRDSRA